MTRWMEYVICVLSVHNKYTFSNRLSFISTEKQVINSTQSVIRKLINKATVGSKHRNNMNNLCHTPEVDYSWRRIAYNGIIMSPHFCTHWFAIITKRLWHSISSHHKIEVLLVTPWCAGLSITLTHWQNLEHRIVQRRSIKEVSCEPITRTWF